MPKVALQVNGEHTEADIPADIGVDSSGNALSQIRTVDSAGLLDINPIADEPLEDVTLGDFFDTWQNNAGVKIGKPFVIAFLFVRHNLW